MSIQPSEKKELKPFPHCPLCGELPSESDPEHGKWVCSNNEEEWPADSYEKKEEAIEAAPHEFDLEADDVFFVGQKKLYRPDDLAIADMVVEQLGEAAYEMCDHWAEDWPDVAPEQIKELDAALNKVMRAWLHKNGLLPNFFTVTAVERHEMPFVLTRTV